MKTVFIVLSCSVCLLLASCNSRNERQDTASQSAEASGEDQIQPSPLSSCPPEENDGIGDPCNHDEDGDQIADDEDACPLDAVQDESGDPCNHKDCADLSEQDEKGNPCVHNSAGDLDVLFGGGDGKVLTNSDHLGNPLRWVNSIATDINDKILAAGSSGSLLRDFAVMRYNADGTPDTTFGTNGSVVTDIGPHDSGVGLVVQSDGKVIQSGHTDLRGDYSFAIIRYNADGTLDTTFGTNGIVITEIPGRCFHRDLGITLAPGGKIIQSAFTRTGCPPGGPADFTFVCYNNDGTLCTDFGSGGAVVISISPETDVPNGPVLIEPSSGKIIAYGSSKRNPEDGESDLALLRLNPNGTPDTTFGSNGIVTYRMGDWSSYISDVVLESSGKIIAGSYKEGGRSPPTNEDWAVLRFNIDGSLDTSFGVNGVIITNLGRAYERIFSIMMEPDGKIIAAGVSGNDFTNVADFALARYNPDGSLDTSFGSNGIVVTDFMGSNLFDIIYSSSLDNDGNILAAGQAFYAPGQRGFAIARYRSTPTP